MPSKEREQEGKSQGARSGGLVVLSNRLPVTIKRSHGSATAERSSGGLVAAMDPAMRRNGGTWAGWAGSLQPGDESALRVEDDAYRLQPIHLSRSDVEKYYHGLSNRTLWPLFHSLPERSRFERKEWEVYEDVNRRFAELADEAAGPDDFVFINDYHLTRCPAYLRQRRPELRIGFFLHIPFPPYDVYRILPWYREVLRGMLACDLVGFHCPGYAANFFDCVERLLGERCDPLIGQVEHGERVVTVRDFPLGIDYEVHEQLAEAAKPAFRGEEQIVLGVDRLDYTKGIPERILAFERLLETKPMHREKVSLLQLAVPSRSQVAEYQALKRQIDELVGRVNGRFGTSSWTPIRYLYRSVPRDRLMAMYRDAAVALVTPLRDGMNLVAKEYVACQVEEPGVLILSRLAGAAERMPEALRVNPYNIDSVAENLHAALTMQVDDRADRMRALQLRERRNDVYAWLDRFMETAEQARPALRPVGPPEFEHWLGDFIDGRRLALFLDYDGTLSELSRHPSEAHMSDAMHQALDACIARADTDVSVISGRSLDDVHKMVGRNVVVYAGNHGLEIAGPGFEPFRHPDIAHYTERAGELAESMEEIRVPGVWVERKGASLTVHFREAELERHAEIAERVRAEILQAGFQPRDAHCAVEARPPIGWDKGHAVLHVLRSRYGPAWSEEMRVIYMGDDETDEDAFRSLEGLGATFRVGGADQPTSARRRLSGVPAVEALMQWLAARPDKTRPRPPVSGGSA
jgi:trehalose 6-phosphate synthase/phosphatase